MDVNALARLFVSGWAVEPPVILGVGIAAVLYWRGLRYSLERGLVRQIHLWRLVAFGGGLLAILLALESPIDYWSTQYFFVHMLEHGLLITVAAPLLLLSAPSMVLWRGLPLPLRRTTLQWIMRQGWPRRLWHQTWTRLLTPRVVWLVFGVTFAAWHVPWLYDLALRNDIVHILEHLLFFGTALLFWALVIPTGHGKPRMSYWQQAVYVFLAALECNVISMMLMFWMSPLYPYYANLQRPAGMIDVVADQRWAGAMMDATGTCVFIVAIVLIVLAWMKADEQDARAEEQALRMRAG